MDTSYKQRNARPARLEAQTLVGVAPSAERYDKRILGR